MGHIGLTPQHVHRLGGMRQQARTDESAQATGSTMRSRSKTPGAFAVVLEAIPDTVAEAVTTRLKIPTIGIGAGPHCDGQVLVSYDMLGLFDAFVPTFVRQYAQLGESILSTAKAFASDVRQGSFPQRAGGPRERHCGSTSRGSITVSAGVPRKNYWECQRHDLATRSCPLAESQLNTCFPLFYIRGTRTVPVRRPIDHEDGRTLPIRLILPPSEPIFSVSPR